MPTRGRHSNLVARTFERSTMVRLLDERCVRRGPPKLSPEVMPFLEATRRIACAACFGPGAGVEHQAPSADDRAPAGVWDRLLPTRC